MFSRDWDVYWQWLGPKWSLEFFFVDVLILRSDWRKHMDCVGIVFKNSKQVEFRGQNPVELGENCNIQFQNVSDFGLADHNLIE